MYNHFYTTSQTIQWSRRTSLLLTFLLSCSPTVRAQAWEPHFERLDRVEGLINSLGNCFFQDRRGFLWIGGTNLKLYDGIQVKSYSHDPEDPRSLSGGSVKGICEDHMGNLWVATKSGLNRFDPSLDEFSRYYYADNPDKPKAFAINCLLLDARGSLILGTSKGLIRLDPEMGHFELLRQFPDQEEQPPIDCMVLARSGDIWFSSPEGVTRFDPRNQQFETFNLPGVKADIEVLLKIRPDVLLVGTNTGLIQLDPSKGGIIRYNHGSEDPNSMSGDHVISLLQDRTGRIWVGTNSNGVNLFDLEKGTFRHFGYRAINPNSLISDTVVSLFEDRSGVIWLGAYTGISKCDPEKSRFTNRQHDPLNDNSLLGEKVFCFYEEKNGIVWIGTNKALNRFDPETNRFRRYRHDPQNENSLSANGIRAIEGDANGHLWLTPIRGGLNRFDPETEEVLRFSLDPNKAVGNPDFTSRALYCDAAGLIWVGLLSGLHILDPFSGNMTVYRNDPEDPKSFDGGNVVDILEDHHGAVWLATLNGLNRLDRDRKTFTSYRHDRKDPHSLRHNRVWGLFQDSDHVIWLATAAGLNKFVPQQGNPESGIFVAFNKKGEMPQSVDGIMADKQGFLWLACTGGIWRFDPRTEKSRQFDASDGVVGTDGNTITRTRNGRMYYGSQSGFVSFDPKELIQNRIAPPISFTEFDVLNKTAEIGPNGPLQRHISTVETITLTHEQKVITFKFAALSYNAPEKNRYAYQMVNFDEKWSEPTRDHAATYTNLDAGKYTFRVKASNHNDFWNEEGIAVVVQVQPPPWLTLWAKALYVLAALAVVAAYIRSQRRKLAAEHNKLDFERSVNKKLQRMDTLKDEFLANTSHELRTPINGIIGLAESINDRIGGNLDANSQGDLSLIVSSGKRLANLVSDILDFEKLKNHSIVLRQGAVDLHALCHVVMALTRPLLVGKDLDLVNDIPEDLPAARGDENRLEQVFFNLIGNAVKFTPSGSVVVSARVNPSGLAISVTDTGIGIPADKHEAIFASFEQVDGSTAREYGGTGLGLAVTRQLVELHDGTISVASEPGQGSVFTFTLPISETKGESRDQSSRPASSLGSPRGEAGLPESHPSRPEQVVTSAEPALLDVDNNLNQRFCILIVDDEPVNRRVLLNHLSLRNYRVVEAADGREAIRLLEGEQLFDLVLLDVMMPGLSGYEVCNILRKSYRLMELPVIFLTAKNQVTDLVTAFEAGGNDFLSKPVAKEELLSRVTTHLQLLDTNRNLEYKVNERTEKLNNRNQHILASINYAQRIQAAILPEIEAMGKSLDEFFVFFRPKDIVSGDFYWCCQLGDMFFIAAVDCTGHGVPGAFMSMIGNTLLNQIVRGDGITDPEQIIWNLHGGIVKSLKQERQIVYATDGMDICLIKIDDREKRVTFVGAGRPLFQVGRGDGKTGDLVVIKGDRNSVGGGRKVHERVYTSREISTLPGDMLYLTTDGYVGQPNSKRQSYGSRRLREILASIALLPTIEQEKALVAELDNFRQDTPQRDDITVIGIRLSF